MNKTAWALAIGLVSILPLLAFASSISNVDYLILKIYDNESRPVCTAMNEGALIYNKDNGMINVCSNDGWRLSDGTPLK